VFDPGLGQIRAGFLFSRYVEFAGHSAMQNKRREKPPRRVRDLYPARALSQGKVPRKQAKYKGFGHFLAD
jgi:hypothetical protein